MAAVSGMGFDARLTLIDPETGAILRRSNNWDRHTEEESAKNLRASGLIPPGGPLGAASQAEPLQIRLAYRVEVHDPDSKPKSDTSWVDADSMTVAFIRIFRVLSQRTGDTAIVQISGSLLASCSVGTAQRICPSSPAPRIACASWVASAV